MIEHFCKFTGAGCLSALIAVSLAVLPFGGCRNPASPEPEWDILLSGESQEELAKLVWRESGRITQLAQNPGERLRIGLSTEGGGVEIVVLSFAEDSDGDLRPTLTRSDGMRAYLRFGLDGLKPTVKFTDADGKTLVAQGQQMSFAVDESALAKIIVSRGQIDLREWVSLGITAVVGGIIIWVGAGVVRLAAVGVGYLAVAAILVGGVVIGAAAFKGLLGVLGWEPADVVALFQGALEDTINILAGAVEQFKRTYNLKTISSSKGQETILPLFIIELF